jgi:hydroxymethylglutaryl-CoA synthase
MTVEIDGYGGYVPLYRIDRSDIAEQHGTRASGESAVPGPDENHVTMASEAALNALARADVPAEEVDAVFTASVTDPFAEHGLASHVAYRLGATGDVRTGDFQGSARAATSAIATAVDVIAAGASNALVVGVDNVPIAVGDDDEPLAGAGAGACVLTNGASSPAASIESIGQETTGFVERHRKHGSPADPGDERFEARQGVADAVGPAVERALASDAAEVAVISVSSARHAKGLPEAVSAAEQVSVRDDVGHVGTASLLLDLVAMLERTDANTTAIVVGYGQGGADAVVLSTANGVGTDDGRTITDQLESKEYVTYGTHLTYRPKTDDNL